ncbi:hypothetical protein PGQ11_007878 [Apiospora arundinis]|uniref:Uncharacterized protein n=1 Tax=Apiospora arundinis TaxID=335852 RepID=A0ABR2IWR1_9PEZI
MSKSLSSLYDLAFVASSSSAPSRHFSAPGCSRLSEAQIRLVVPHSTLCKQSQNQHRGDKL